MYSYRSMHLEMRRVKCDANPINRLPLRMSYYFRNAESDSEYVSSSESDSVYLKYHLELL